MSDDIMVTGSMIDKSISVENEPTRSKINQDLTVATAESFLTPYIALERVASTLAKYHIHIPKFIFTDSLHDYTVFEVNQFGNKVGMTDDGQVVTSTATPGLYIYFEYQINDDGTYEVFSEVVTEEELEDLISDGDDEDTEEEDVELDEETMDINETSKLTKAAIRKALTKKSNPSGKDVRDARDKSGRASKKDNFDFRNLKLAESDQHLVREDSQLNETSKERAKSYVDAIRKSRRADQDANATKYFTAKHHGNEKEAASVIRKGINAQTGLRRAYEKLNEVSKERLRDYQNKSDEDSRKYEKIEKRSTKKYKEYDSDETQNQYAKYKNKAIDAARKERKRWKGWSTAHKKLNGWAKVNATEESIHEASMSRMANYIVKSEKSMEQDKIDAKKLATRLAMNMIANGKFSAGIVPKDGVVKNIKVPATMNESQDDRVSVKKNGEVVTVHNGASRSYPIHPKDHAKIMSLQDGEKHTYRDETRRTVVAQRMGDQVHFWNKEDEPKHKRYEPSKVKVSASSLQEASNSELYHKSYTNAIQHAVSKAEARGYSVDSSDYDSKVAAGPRKPGEGKTVSHILKLNKKDGSPTKKTLAIQVYNRGGETPYELNHYISEESLDEVSTERLDKYTAAANADRLNKGSHTAKGFKRVMGIYKAQSIKNNRKHGDPDHKPSSTRDNKYYKSTQ